jgi:hypothetical protein
MENIKVLSNWHEAAFWQNTREDKTIPGLEKQHRLCPVDSNVSSARSLPYFVSKSTFTQDRSECYTTEDATAYFY